MGKSKPTAPPSKAVPMDPKAVVAAHLNTHTVRVCLCCVYMATINMVESPNTSATSQEQASSIDAALLVKLGLTVEQQSKVREKMPLGSQCYLLLAIDLRSPISGFTLPIP